MRIAYSCAGEGYGHTARMVALSNHLCLRNEMVLYVPQPVQAFVKDRLSSSRIYTIPCFKLKKRKNRIQYLPTLRDALRDLPAFYASLRHIARSLYKEQIDVVLSDFDPYLPWAARIAGIPVVQMNHPGIVQRYTNLDPRTWLSSALSRFLEGPWDVRILISFYGGDVGPVLRDSLLQGTIRDDGYIAVNLKNDTRKLILPILDSIPGLRYKLYPNPKSDFDMGLRHCSGVITNGGHQTLSEALVLGKPVLSIPQEGQYEQYLNALMLERSGGGYKASPRELPFILPNFLASLGKTKKRRILSTQFKTVDSKERLLALLEASFTRVCRRKIRMEQVADEQEAV